jgi:hypothetical protein
MTAKHYANCHSLVGGTAFVASLCLVGTLALKIQDTRHGGWVLAVFSTFVVALTAVQTFKKYDSLSYVHDSLRGRFSSVCRDIEVILHEAPADRGNPAEVLRRFQQRLDELALTNMPVPEHIWKGSTNSNHAGLGFPK